MGYSSDTRPKMESLFPRIFLNGPGKHDTMKDRKRPRIWAAKILFTEASAYELDLPP